MTKRQYIFAVYLLKKIGFLDKKIINDYLGKLESIFGQYIEVERKHTNKQGYSYITYSLVYSASGCIDELLKEVEIKKKLNNIQEQKINEKDIISATDLSNFNFCSASYSISRSFKVEFPTQEGKQIAGSKLHETLRLVDKKLPSNITDYDVASEKIVESPSIKKIKNCELLFCGHKEKDEYFFNEIYGYIGQPDYIFQDPNGCNFVVEEKFRYLNNYEIEKDSEDYDSKVKYRKMVKSQFYLNHIIQLQSYIEYIKEFDLSYGILIYWFYELRNEIPFVHSFNFKVIKKGQYIDALNTTYQDLKDFKSNKKLNFNRNINSSKCAACVVNKYCTHKTGENDELVFPYKKNDLKLKYIEFPDDLKKENKK